jgi:hypothetical protein
VAEKVEAIATRVDGVLPKALERCRRTLQTRRRYLLLVIELQQHAEWIETQHASVATKFDYGATLQTAKKAQRRLEALQLAFDSRNESQFKRVLAEASEFAESDDPDEQRKADITTRSTRLRSMRDIFAKQLADWGVMLSVAVDYVTLLEELGDAQSWFDDHAIDGDDEVARRSADANTEQLKLLDELVVEANAFDSRVASLRDRFDAVRAPVRERLGPETEATLRSAFEALAARHVRFGKALSDRREHLDDAKRFFELERRANELLAVIAEQSRVAESINYGHDLEHCRVLEAEFTEFVQLTVCCV